MYSTLENPTQCKTKDLDFSEIGIRLRFIRKVYSLLACQLLLTFGIVALIFFNSTINEFVLNNIWLFFVVFGVGFVTLTILVWCSSVARKTPINYIFLFIFTVAESYLVGVISTQFRGKEILLAVGIAIVIFFSLTLFAFQTKWDFTGLNIILFVCLMGLIIIGMLTILWTNGIKEIIYSSVAAILFSFYIIHDTQMIMGGKHRYSISPDEYVYATLSLYLDIINIYMDVIRIIRRFGLLI